MKRRTWILLAILGVLAVAAYFVLRQPGEVSVPVTTGNYLLHLDSAAVDRMEIKSRSDSVVLEKRDGVWMVTSPVRYRADNVAITAALLNAQHLDLKTLISSNPQKQDLFQVDSTGLLIKVFENGAEKAAFRIGKPTSAYTDTYVRRENSSDVYVAAGSLHPIFERKIRDWRDKTIYRTVQESIASVKFQYGDTTFTLAFQDSVWRIGNEKATDATVKTFMSYLSNLQADEFIDTAISSMPRLTGTLETGGVQIRCYFNAANGKYYVQTSQSPQWFEIENWRGAQILKRMKDFIPGT